MTLASAAMCTPLLRLESLESATACARWYLMLMSSSSPPSGPAAPAPGPAGA